MYNNVHSHPVEKEPEEPVEVHGLDPTIQYILTNFIGEEAARGVCILSLKPSEVMSHIVCLVKKNTEYIAIRRHLQQRAYHEKVFMQVRGSICRQREAYLVEELGGYKGIPKNDTLIRILQRYCLVPPAAYQPRANYKSALELA